jgi:hypothetical protein
MTLQADLDLELSKYKAYIASADGPAALAALDRGSIAEAIELGKAHRAQLNVSSTGNQQKRPGVLTRLGPPCDLMGNRQGDPDYMDPAKLTHRPMTRHQDTYPLPPPPPYSSKLSATASAVASVVRVTAPAKPAHQSRSSDRRWQQGPADLGMPYGFPPLPDTSTSDLAAACEEKDRTIRELKASASRHGELVDRLYRDIKALQASLQQSRKDKEKYKSKYQSLQQDMRARDLTASLLAPQAQQPPAYHQEE